MSAIQTVTDRERDLAERLAAEQQRDLMLIALRISRGNVASLGPAGALEPHYEYREWLRMIDDALAGDAAILRQRDARTLREAADIADQWGNARTDDQGGHALRNYAARIRNMAAELESKNG